MVVEKPSKLFGSGGAGEETVQSLKEGSVDDFSFSLGQLWVYPRKITTDSGEQLLLASS